MSIPTLPRQAAPYSALLRSRSLSCLWMLRMLVRMNGLGCLMESRDVASRNAVFERLRLPRVSSTPDEEERMGIQSELTATLERMEQRAGQYQLGRRLRNNLALMGRQFALTAAERHLLALAVLLRTDEELQAVARSAKHQVNVTDQLRVITKLPESQIRKAVAPSGRLRRSGLIEVGGGHHPAHNFQLRRGGLRVLATAKLESVDELFQSFLQACPAAILSSRDYAHLGPKFDLISGLIKEAVASQRKGVNILLHGPPGTGKTELTRTISGQLGIASFEVSSIDEDGDALTAKARLAGAATAQYLLAGRKAILVFDEIDPIFNDGSRFFGKPTTAEAAKAWVNNLLEQAPIPTLWIGNDIGKMDPAFLRRFDLVVELDTPPMSQRVQLLEQVCGELVDPGDIRRLATSEALTPAIVTRAANVARRLQAPGDTSVALLETVLDGTLRAQGQPTVRQSYRGQPADNYDPLLCNASQPLDQLARGLAEAQSGRICLYGPPGTGKTEFGYWLARTLDKPLVLKRTSDLQSPYLGVMERNLARAFEQAARDNAVLQIDEVDSFLRDRASARQAWEVSQVNEFLTQLESFDGIFVASTNLMDGLDPAALRRFDYKVQFGYMAPDQATRMLRGQLHSWGIAGDTAVFDSRKLVTLDRLTPGDFAVIRRQHRMVPFKTSESVLEALHREVELKVPAHRRIGFV